jgi:hypothetical protein
VKPSHKSVSPSWPPDEAGWAAILDELSDANRGAVRAAVDVAVQEYRAKDPRVVPKASSLREWFQRLEKQARSKTIASFCKLLKQIETKDPTNPDREQLLRLADEMARLGDRVRAWVDLYKPRSRRHRLDSALLSAWTTHGKRELADSDEGPQARFYLAIIGRVVGKRRGGTHRAAAKREKKRRELLKILHEVIAGEGSLLANAIIPPSDAQSGGDR